VIDEINSQLSEDKHMGLVGEEEDEEEREGEEEEERSFEAWANRT
jgi:hypothetical protein